MFFNTHTHLNSEQLYNERDMFIERALKNHVSHFVVAGYDLESSRKAVQIAQEYPFVYATVGISPNDCLNTTDEELCEIEKLLQNPRVVALGEIGLDYHYTKTKFWLLYAKSFIFISIFQITQRVYYSFSNCFS